MRNLLSTDAYINGIFHQDRIILSKAITLIESNRKEDEALAADIITACLQAKKQSKRIAITGVPGAGKSTFINAWGKLLLDAGNKIAVLAVDPSSSISKGSILADKTRMEDLVNHENCYIRPTASNSNLGGVARSTRDTIILCEAFGFDYILIETVGVGQSETVVKNMTDLFVLLLLPNAGDDLQGIKRGIMEMADIILINKSEEANKLAAKTAAAQVKQALHLNNTTEKNWAVPVINISSTQHTGLQDLQQQVESYFLKMNTSGYLQFNRLQQEKHWLEENLLQEILRFLNSNSELLIEKNSMLEKIKNKEISPTMAARVLLQKIIKQ